MSQNNPICFKWNKMNRYESAKEIYAQIGVDTDLAIEKYTCITSLLAGR